MKNGRCFVMSAGSQADKATQQVWMGISNIVSPMDEIKRLKREKKLSKWVELLSFETNGEGAERSGEGEGERSNQTHHQ